MDSDCSGKLLSTSSILSSLSISLLAGFARVGASTSIGTTSKSSPPSSILPNLRPSLLSLAMSCSSMSEPMLSRPSQSWSSSAKRECSREREVAASARRSVVDDGRGRVVDGRVITSGGE